MSKEMEFAEKHVFGTSYEGPKSFPVAVEADANIPVTVILIAFKEANAELIHFHPIQSPPLVIGGKPRVYIRFYYWMSDKSFSAMFPGTKYNVNAIYSLNLEGKK